MRSSSKARLLRKNPTDAEKALWQKLRNRGLVGYKFRRQFTIGPYVVDFFCQSAQLIVEVDGGQHAQEDRDKQRDLYLKENGYEVVRFWNNEILQNLEGLLESLTLTLSQRERELLPPRHSGKGWGEGKMPTQTQLIAPCGMNCGICMAYLRNKNKCPGCWGDDTPKAVTVVRCIIKNCETIKTNKSKFCYECEKYPCKRLKQLDKRYRTKYHMSMIENLENIKRIGLNAFVENENARWRCQKCGGVICVHRGYCLSCGTILKM